jgi:glutamate-1-semialdehyde 2,1-aminomutase
MTAALPVSDLARRMQQRAHHLIPGGAHTYAKGDDQFPENAPPFIVRGQGCHAWDLDGREYIEYGMGLRAVTLGHAFAPVVEAATRQLQHGVNFTRPAPIELECAETLLSMVPGAEMVKFCKDGSHAVDGAIRLARAATGRDLVAICGCHPFFSTSDWFIGTGEMDAGIPQAVSRLVLKFDYNDRASLQALFDAHPGRIACVLMEAARIDEPAGDYLQWVKQCANDHGALLVFDEMITGFRWHNGGAQTLYGVTPDLATFGKALANGFSVSALAGRRELMKLGGLHHDQDRVFLLSTTHGAQTHELAAAIATMRFYRDHPVVEVLQQRGARLRQGIEQAATALGLSGQVGVVSRDCNLLFYTRDAQGQPSQPLRTLFMQELVRGGVIAPSFVVSWSHSEADIDRTVDAAAAAMQVYRRALDGGVERFLQGRPVQPVFRRRP